MTYIALRDISIGEEINPSYIIDIHSTCRKGRRDKLLKTKNFLCECDSCRDVDYCRCLKCPNTTCIEKKCGALNLGNENNENGENEKWRGISCGLEFSPLMMESQIKTEESLINRYLSLKSKLEFQSVSDPLELRSIIEDGEKMLSPTHYLVANTYRLLYHFAAGQYDSLKEQGIKTNNQLMSPWGEVISPTKFAQEAADACIRVVRIRECIAAKCNNCCLDGVTCVLGTHDADYDACIDVFYAIEKLVVVSSIKSIDTANVLYQRYKIFLDASVGEDDMRGMELVLKKVQLKQEKNATTSTVVKRSCNLPSCTSTAVDLKACSRYAR